VNHVEYVLKKTGHTDGRTDGRQIVTLRLATDAASKHNNAPSICQSTTYIQLWARLFFQSLRESVAYRYRYWKSWGGAPSHLIPSLSLPPTPPEL